MKKISSAIVKMVVVIIAVFSLIIAVNAGNVSDNLNPQKEIEIQNTQRDFYANITFNIYKGDGCGCIPLRGIHLNATGRDTDHSTSGLTNDDGRCVLQLEYYKTYRISIQETNLESVLFNFVVIDNQMFSFHIKEIETSSLYNFSFIQIILQRILLVKK